MITLSGLLPALLAAAGAALAAPLLARVAPRLRLMDGAEGPAAARKHQRRAVPVVGGVAVVLGLLVGAALAAAEGLHEGALPLAWGGVVVERLPWFPGPGAALLALTCAFGVGLVDDLLRGGLPPLLKLALQALCGVAAVSPLLLFAFGPEALAWAAVAAGIAAVATNAINTFDNSDGAAGLLGAMSLAGPLPLAAGALLGFLPFNVDGERPARRGLPTCYLGDAGSHVVGMLVALTPVAWPALCLPLLDLARLSVVRTLAGSRPWVGDRRHLAHRLEARGLSRAAVLGALAAAALPSVVLGGWGTIAGAPLLVLVGALGTASVYAALLLATPDPVRVALPSPTGSGPATTR